ncbi:MAG: phosphonate transport system permease protein [Planctomycetota bacterium]|jgi:phosphonate transport system permease protein
MSDSKANVRRLHRARPRSPFVRGSILIFCLGAAVAWGSGVLAPGDIFSARRQENLMRFLSTEALPAPLRNGEGMSGLFDWMRDLWVGKAAAATGATLQLALVSAVLAGLGSLLIAPLVARTLACPDPYGAPGPQGWRWRILNTGARLGCVLARALPEFVLAYLLIALVPSASWAAVLALAIHNGGILGRLFGETFENSARTPSEALATLGAKHVHLVFAAGLPLALPRLFAYFFYRLETCVRDATVLGLLGVASLGHVIVEARARGAYDELLFFVGCGAAIVLLADRLSHFFRTRIREAT